MKYTIRRFIFGIVTTPIALAGYGLVYFGLGLLGGGASVTAYLNNITAICFGYLIAITFIPQIFRLVDKVVN